MTTSKAARNNGSTKLAITRKNSAPITTITATRTTKEITRDMDGSPFRVCPAHCRRTLGALRVQLRPRADRRQPSYRTCRVRSARRDTDDLGPWILLSYGHVTLVGLCIQEACHDR